MTAEELYSRAAEIARAVRDSNGVGQYAQLCPKLLRHMHETLVMACAAGIADTRQAFGNLFSQVDYLCKRHRIRIGDVVDIQAMRRHSNTAKMITPEQLLYDVRALSIFISAVFGESIPSTIVGMVPQTTSDKLAQQEEARRDRYPYVRCIVDAVENTSFSATTDDIAGGHSVMVDLSAEHLRYLHGILRPGMQLNLLDSRSSRGDKGGLHYLQPSLIIIEPDFLIDISTIASCFQQYGQSPLNYIVKRLMPPANTQPILLGNLASAVLDDAINSPETTLNDTIRHNFRDKAIAFSTCDQFNSIAFKEDARRQSDNIRRAIDVLKHDSVAPLDADKALLEPSFVCEQLGISGRVDLMSTDKTLLVEQKSGKNWAIEIGQKGRYGVQVEEHYVQMLLYYGVLQYNFHLRNDRINMHLLYSKYPPDHGLVSMNFFRGLFRDAIKLRNRMVAMDMVVADRGFESVFPLLTPEKLNENHSNSTLYIRYQLPQLQSLLNPLHSLSPLEKDYFCHMMTFLFREQRVARLGLQEGIGSSAADLWNMPLAEKRETGNIYTGLTITKKEKSEPYRGYDLITLAVPDQGDDFLPNFRRGDSVYLYEYQDEPDVRRSILFKGSLKEISTTSLTVALTDGQQNPNILQPQPAPSAALSTQPNHNFSTLNPQLSTLNPQPSTLKYALEHSPGDLSQRSKMRSLYNFITAPQSFRDLLLAQREPLSSPQAPCSAPQEPCSSPQVPCPVCCVANAAPPPQSPDPLTARALSARDYFLLIGPPGTGKTSRSLRRLVETELSSSPQTAILLMSYTNRAVDEICSMLEDAAIDYLRIGSPYRCDPRFQDRLFANSVASNPSLAGMKQLLAQTRVIVGTTTTMSSQEELFRIKHFSLAIIDEASQILEPDIIGLLSLLHANHSPQEEQGGACSSRFILIGDHKQLPAVVQQSINDSKVDNKSLQDIGLDNCRNSLFERLLRIERRAGREQFIGILNRQGRMHPDIADFPCRMFYARENISPVPLPHQIEPSDPQRRVIFIPSDDCREPGRSDKVNINEAIIVRDQLKRIYEEHPDDFSPQQTVGVIVPYRNQIAVIRREIETLGIDPLQQISIDTVERYQGSQRDIIIYSFTIQNPYQLDFLTANCFVEDGVTIDRKLNVALTRARKQLIITGNRSTITRNPLFLQLVRSIETAPTT